MKTSSYYRKMESGRSIVEMLGVLILMGLITIIAMMWWAKAMDNQRANAIEEEVSKRAALYENRGTSQKTGFVTQKMYNDTKKMVYGYGITPVTLVTSENHESHLEIRVGGINEGRAISKSTCELLKSRLSVITDKAGSQKVTSPIQEWKALNRQGEELQGCGPENTMVAKLKFMAADVGEREGRTNVFNDQCQTSNDCPENQECRRKVCIACPKDYYREAGQSGCVAGCQLTFKGRITTEGANACKKCNESTGKLVDKANGDACGPEETVNGKTLQYGKCNKKSCSLCALWNSNATALQKTCGKCDWDSTAKKGSGLWTADPAKDGKGCFYNRGKCEGRFCVCDKKRYWVPNAENAINVTGCVCREDTRRVPNSSTGSDCICDSNKGWAETETKEPTCRCKKGWTKADDAVPTCVKCSQTTYKDFIGDKACKDCGGNKITRAVGGTQSSDCGCRPGQYLKNGSCTNCTDKWTGTNHKNQQRGYTDAWNQSTSCTLCPEGNKAVHVDKKIGEVAVTSGYTGCSPCYVDDDGNCGCDEHHKPYGSGSCSECSDHHPCGGEGSIKNCSSTDHKCHNKVCPGGQHVNARTASQKGQEVTCSQCDAGTYAPANNSWPLCGNCTGNTYSAAGASSCTACSGTKPKANSNHTACVCNGTSCGSGKYCNSNGNCGTCSGGTPYTKSDGSGCVCSGTSCGTGKYCKSDGTCGTCSGETPNSNSAGTGCVCNSTSCGAHKYCSGGTCHDCERKKRCKREVEKTYYSLTCKKVGSGGHINEWSVGSCFSCGCCNTGTATSCTVAGKQKDCVEYEEYYDCP